MCAEHDGLNSQLPRGAATLKPHLNNAARMTFSHCPAYDDRRHHYRPLQHFWQHVAHSHRQRGLPSLDQATPSSSLLPIWHVPEDQISFHPQVTIIIFMRLLDDLSTNQPACSQFIVINQWSFRETGTMGTQASQAVIGVWVQAPGTLLRGPGGIPPENVEIVCAKSCNLVHFGWKVVRSAVHNAFVNILTVGTPFQRVLPRNDACHQHRHDHLLKHA